MMVTATTIKRAFLIKLLALIVCIASISPAYSEISVKAYEGAKDSQSFKLYLSGVERGYSWANTALDLRGQAKLYCVPTKLSLTFENYANILAKELADNPEIYALNTPVELILLNGLIKTFPCK